MAERRWSPHVAVALAVLLGGIAREAACRHGLPYLVNSDEYGVAGAALDMLKRRGLDPLFYGYGALVTYVTLAVDALWALWLQGLSPDHPESLSSMGALVVGAADGVGPPTSHPSFYYVSRLLVAVLGTGTIVTTARLAERLAGAWAGVVAAFLLAASTAHAYQSGFSLPNVPMALLASLIGLATLDHREGKRGLGLAAIWVGLATGCKITGILLLVVPIAAMLARRSWPATRDVVSVLFVPPLVFLVSNPFLPFKWRTVMAHLAVEARFYFVAGMPEYEAPPGLGQLVAQLQAFADGFGLVPMLLAGIGCVALARRPNGWVAVLPIVALTVFFSLTRSTFHRNLLAVYPFLAVAAGCAVVTVGSALPRGLARGLLGAVVGILLVGRATETAYRFRQVLAAPATRTVLVQRLAERPEQRVALFDELRIHPDDRARIPHAVTGRFLDLACSDRADVALVPLAFHSNLDQALAQRMNALLPPVPSTDAEPVRPGDARDRVEMELAEPDRVLPPEPFTLESPVDRAPLLVAELPLAGCP